MSSAYIDLTLVEHGLRLQEDSKAFVLADAIEDNSLVVLLGSPGSGKTSLLKKYAEEKEDTTGYYPINHFLKLNRIDVENKTTILLDGLDEYKSSSTVDKNTAILDLVNKIHEKELVDKNIVISCRELDWYGDVDLQPLGHLVRKPAKVFAIENLSNDEQLKLAEVLKIENPREFVDRYAGMGFLENPQLFNMFVELHNNNPHLEILSKKDLYLRYVELCKDKNTVHRLNNTIIRETDLFFKLAGYLAVFSFFSEITDFTSQIDDIADSQAGYTVENLEKVLNSPLFLGKATFVHRTIAEFLAAHYLYNHKVKNKNITSRHRLRGLFEGKNSIIPSELRGVYAWLCVFTQDIELIKLDPYSQAIYGDNSGFSIEFKELVLKEIKAFSFRKPYFHSFRYYHELEGFYRPELDAYLIQQLEESLPTNSHYAFFLLSLITIKPSDISPKMRDYLKEKIFDKTAGEDSEGYKSYILRAFRNVPEVLKKSLEMVVSGEFEDSEDSIKDFVLWHLYPVHITPKEIASYLFLYKSNNMGNCSYLFKTPYEEKRVLVQSLLKTAQEKNSDYFMKELSNVLDFINDFYLETCLKFEDPSGLTMEEIFEVLKKCYEYYPKHESLQIESVRVEINEKLEKYSDKMQSLANELFVLYVDFCVENDSFDDIYHRFNLQTFGSLFPLKMPRNYNDAIIAKIRVSNRSNEIKSKLFPYLMYPSIENTIPTELKDLAEEFDLIQLLEEIYKKRKERQKQIEEGQKTRELKIIEKQTAFESHYASKKAIDIINNMQDMLSITNLHLISDPIPDRMRNLSEELKGLFQQVYTEIINRPELILKNRSLSNIGENVKSLFFDNYYISQIFYVASALTSYERVKEIDENLRTYLYINSFIYKNVTNIIKIEWVGRFEAEFAADAQAMLYNLFLNYVDATTTEKIAACFIKRLETIAGCLDNLKRLARFLTENGDFSNFILLFLEEFGFVLDISELEMLLKEDVKSSEENIIKALIVLKKVEKAENAKVDADAEFDMLSGISIYRLLQYSNDRFKAMPFTTKCNFLNLAFNLFDSFAYSDNTSPRDLLHHFLTLEVWELLSLDEVKALYELRKSKNDLWSDRLLNLLYQQDSNEADSFHGLERKSMLRSLKDYLLTDGILNERDFFYEVYNVLLEIKDQIVDNRDNEKERFYNGATPLYEEPCRDRLKGFLEKYEHLMVIREGQEGNNRVDLNIKYKNNLTYEVQVECKRTTNRDINNAINEQLILKYLKTSAPYGIYLIFDFNSKITNKKLEALYKTIPSEKTNNIKIVVIDLEM